MTQDLEIPSPIAAEPVRTSRAVRRAGLGAFLSVAINATNYVVVKAAIEIAPPILLSCARVALAAAVLFVILAIREGSIGMSRRDLRAIALLSLVGISVYQLLWTTALETTTAGSASLIISSGPVLTMLIAAIARTDTLSRAKLAGALISLAGVVIVVIAGHGQIGAITIGDVFAFATAVCWAVSVALGAPVIRRLSPLRSGAWMMAFGALGLLPIAIYQGIGFDIARMTPDAYGGILYSGILGGAVAGVLMFNGIAVMGPNRFAVLQFLAPAITLIVGFVVLGEPIGPAQVLGGGVIIGGIALALAAGAPKPRALSRSSSNAAG